jgi:hypothetical protein
VSLLVEVCLYGHIAGKTEVVQSERETCQISSLLISRLCFTQHFSLYLKITRSFSEGNTDESPPERRLDAVLHLAELCIDLLQQNEEHHSEVKKLNSKYA